MTQENNKKISGLEELVERAKKLHYAMVGKTVISICSGTGCKAYSSDEVHSKIEEELLKEIKAHPEKSVNIIIKKTGCHGYCERGPIMVIYPQETCYLGVKPEDAAEIVEKTVKGEIVERLLYKDEEGKQYFKRNRHTLL